jgi:oleate hydratase
MTARGPLFPDLMEKLTGSAPGRGGLITLTGSNWLVTLNSFHNPHFLNQPEDVSVWWGYGLYLDRPGNFVAKNMPDGTGSEIIEELLGHLGLEKHRAEILSTMICIPCLLPYAGSVLLKRRRVDRPDVVPESSTNLAFIGQFAEVEDEAVFTTEYAVRTAREAVARLLKTDRPPPPVYKGQFDPGIIAAAVRTFAS